MDTKPETAKPRRTTWRKRIIVVSTLALGTIAVTAAAQDRATPESALTRLLRAFAWAPVPKAEPILDRKLIARAEPDECFVQIGYPSTKPPCSGDSKPKVNQAYIWAGARSGNYAWFGTIANTACLAPGGYFLPLQGWVSEGLVCEEAAGKASREHGLYTFGDQRPPKVYRLDADTDVLEDRTPEGDPLLETTLGLRGAGAHRDVVLLAGPNAAPKGIDGLNIWAFEGSTGKLLGSRKLTQFANIRRGIVVKDELYLAVRKAGEQYGVGGAIVKWTGDKADPFRFEVVGDLGSEPGYVTEHEGRIAVSGWTGVTPAKAIGEMTSMYLSPPIPIGGLTAKDTKRWQKIFSIDQYDPDPVIAHATHFGDLVSWHGKLYFATYQVPLFQTLNAFTFYGRPDTWMGRLFTYEHAERATAMFEMENVGELHQKVTLLYGEESLPAFDTHLRVWLKKPNNLEQTPKLGASGFGNRFNYYPWTWTLFQNKLYMATFDASDTSPDTFAGLLAQPSALDLPPYAVGLLRPYTELVFERYAGGDIWRMDAPDKPAVPEDTSGFGNRYNYGIRVWVPFEDKGKLYGGTANPFNLRSGPSEPGGWELLRFTPRR
ncbi:Hypothetical protein A7982_05418 [Minicystis rosea]|nr:Hypothetical protein A7982_05418 [Minicystis rosea]